MGLSWFSTSGARRTLLNIYMMKLLYENSSRLKVFNHFRRQSIIINACQGPLYTSSKYSFRLNKKKTGAQHVLIAFMILHKKNKSFRITDCFSKCDQIRKKLRIWSHLLKKSLSENFIFGAVWWLWGNFCPLTNFHLSVFNIYHRLVLQKKLHHRCLTGF